MKFKTLPPSSLEKLVNSGKPVYVVNTSVLPSGDKGMIVVNFFDGTRREFFKMPPTFIPIAVTDSIPPKRLTESRDFKQCLVKGMLTLIDPAQAEDYLATSEAREEYESLMLSEHSIKSKAAAANVEPRQSVATYSGDAAGPQDVNAVDTISNKVRGLMEMHKAGDITGKQVRQDLKRHEEALTIADLGFVKANTMDQDVLDYVNQVVSSLSHKPAAAKRKTNVPTRKVAPAVKKKTAAEHAAFDFSDDDLSPEEARADAEARSKAMQNQVLNPSTGVEAVDALLKG